MIRLSYFFIFVFHTATSILPPVSNLDPPGDYERFTCFTLCTNKAQSISFCVQTALARAFLQEHVYDDLGDLSGKELKAWKKEQKCKHQHIPKEIGKNFGIDIPCDIFTCEGIFPKCTIDQFKCNKEGPAVCDSAIGDRVLTCYNDSTIICSGGSSYLRSVEDIPYGVCPECIIPGSDIQYCGASRCLLTVSNPMAAALFSSGSAGSPFTLSWCPNDQNKC